MFHINIVDVVTAQITPLADFSCVSLDLFSIHFIITLHSSIAATSASQYKKKKLNLTKCYQFFLAILLLMNSKL